MIDYNKLAVKYGVFGEYKNACKKESSGAGNGWRINLEKAIDEAEKGHDIDAMISLFCGKKSISISHIESGLRYRD